MASKPIKDRLTINRWSLVCTVGRVLLVNADAEVPFLTDGRVCMVGRVLLDNNGAEVPFLTDAEVCTLVVE